ncbi:MAG: hypothetical protein ACRD8Z_04070 [Nitrososphaeraceae archaeon]
MAVKITEKNGIVRRRRINRLRYSTGPKWSGQYDPYKPAFWRTYQPGIYKQRSDDELLPSGYGRTETWITLCKSWNGFLLAKREGDRENMKQYAMHDGLENPIDQERNEECVDKGNQYYRGWLAGCVDAGNTRETCEAFTGD